MAALLVGNVVGEDGDLHRFLERMGTDARCCSATEALRHARHRGIRCVLLIGVRGDAVGPATRIIRRLRRAGIRAPALLIVYGDITEGLAKLLGSGEADFIRRSSVDDELRVRFAALARRATHHAAERLHVGNLEIDRDSHVIRRGRDTVELTQKEYRLLEYLAEHGGESVRREDLARHVWGSDARERRDRNRVDVYVLYVRRKLSALGCRSALKTVRGVGYMLLVEPDSADHGAS